MRDKYWSIGRLGKMPQRRSRHLNSQMKFYSGKRFKDQYAQSFWGFANKQALKYKDNSWTGLN